MPRLQAFDHARVDGMHLGLDAGDQHLVVQRPQAHRVVLVQRLAGAWPGPGARRRARSRGSAGAGTPAAPTAAGTLPCVGFHEPSARVHALAAVEHPVRQRRLAQRLAGVDVVLDPLRHLLPAGLLPQLEGALLDAEAPAHGEVDVARAVGDGAQVHGRIVEAVAMQRPQELRLRVARFAQQLQPLGARASSACARRWRRPCRPRPRSRRVAASKRWMSLPTFL